MHALFVFSTPSAGGRHFFCRRGPVRWTPAWVWLVYCALAACWCTDGLADTPAAIEIDARRVSLTAQLQPGEGIAGIRFLGMLALPSLTVNGIRFAQLSDLAWDDDDEVLYAVSDKGALFHLRPRFENNILIGVDMLRAVRLQELDTGKPLRGRRIDAEGMDIRNSRNGHRGDAELAISFERFPRVIAYRPDGRALRAYALPAALANRADYQRGNRMLEAICLDTRIGYVTTPETPLTNEPAGITHLFGGAGEQWFYPIEPGMRISALECLGERRVLVLERDFGRIVGHAVAALKLASLPEDPSPDTPVAVKTVITMNTAKGFQIDNFEGLARYRGNRFFLVSDDNDLFVQRTLLLHLEILGNR